MSKKKKRAFLKFLKWIFIIAIICVAFFYVTKLFFPNINNKIVSFFHSIISVDTPVVQENESSVNDLYSLFGKEKTTQSTTTTTNKTANTKKVKKNTTVPTGLEIPSPVKDHEIVSHNTYTLSYNEEYECPDWVAYTLVKDDYSTSNASRTEDFREDPLVSTESAHLDDYRGSGYDRGHMLSAQNRTISTEAMSETFYLSNMCPQDHDFNAGLFLTAERGERDSATQFGKLYVVTGPVFTSNMKRVGKCKVAVPESFYKVFLGFDSEGNAHSIGLVLPQEYTDGNLHTYIKSVNEIEALTGIDFFPSLDDKIEESVENQKNKKDFPKRFW